MRCATRQRPVHTLLGLDVPDVSPATGSAVRCPLPSTGSSSHEFPGFAGTMRHSDPCSPISLGSLRSPSDTAVAPRPALPPAEDAPSGGRGASSAVPPQTAAKDTTERAGLPGSWGVLRTVRSALGPRSDRHARPLRRADAAPACVENEGSGREKFRGSMSELSAWRPTLRSGSRPTPRKACFRLLASSTGWDWLPTEPRRKVSAMHLLHPFPLSQA